MRKETNEAMNALVQDLVNTPLDLPKTSGDLTELICIVDSTESDLRDCVNELCLKCGNYHESYLGACDGCRWKVVKEGFR
jgi:hypothetical protein